MKKYKLVEALPEVSTSYIERIIENPCRLPRRRFDRVENASVPDAYWIGGYDTSKPSYRHSTYWIKIKQAGTVELY